MIHVNWHARFLQQAQWTRQLRDYLFERTNINDAGRVLEVGCGTGAVLISLRTPASIFGVDIAQNFLISAHSHTPRAILTRADGLALPFASQTMEIVYCHFLLLWVHDPLQALREMARVTSNSGFILAFAEPDYSRRIDKPDSLAPLGRWQTESLLRQGADPNLGQRLAELFVQAGIKIIEAGILSGQNEYLLTPEQYELEWDVLEADLIGYIPAAKIRNMKKLDKQARKHGERVLQVPIHFVWGQLQ